MNDLNLRRSRPTNDETCTARHMLTGLWNTLNKQNNSIKLDDWTQSSVIGCISAQSQQFDGICMTQCALRGGI
jgi:hypothetical protein